MEQIGGARRTIFMPNDKVLYDSARTGWAIFDLKTTKTCSFYGIKLKQPQNLSFEYYRGREKDILLMYYTISEGDYSENIYTLIDAQNFQAAEAIYNTYDEQTIIPKADSDVEELFKIEEERIRKKLEVKVSKNKLAKLGQICELVSGEIPSA